VKKRIIFIADFYTDQIHGGGEKVNDILIESLERLGYPVEKYRTNMMGDYQHQFPPTEIKEISKKVIDENDVFIFAGFREHMSEDCQSALAGKDYIIMEHDHKYLKTRDPSMFKDYLAPKDMIVSHEFYGGAKAILCQSKIHAEVVNKNLDTGNVINLGCSMWSESEIAAILKASEKDKTKNAAVLRSNNIIKGTSEASEFCRRKDIEHDFIGGLDYPDFISAMAEYKKFVFFPQVLESFCRLVVEARMLGCELMTNEKNGCTSEEWFGKLKGKELISFVEEKKTEIIDTIVKIVEDMSSENIFLEKSTPADITVILNSYRRPYNLKMQIEAIRSQTNPPKQIWLWINHHEDNEGFDYSELGIDRIIHNDHNWKFYGRFAGALLSDTEYVAIFDDDTIPGRKWFKNCLDTMSEQEGIMGSAGVILNDKYYVKHDRCGWPSHNEETEEVDLVGHAWFFKRDWLQYLWREKPPTWDNGEDMQFSYTAQKYGGIKTFCPPHPSSDLEMHGSTKGNELGVDAKATSNNNETTHQQFFSERDLCVQSALRSGWKTVRGIKL